MKRKITIIFKGKNAYVELNKEQFDARVSGLIQYLSEFCSHIFYNVYDSDMKSKDYDKGFTLNAKKVEE